MSVGTVKSTLHRALARLRAELEQGCYGYGSAMGAGRAGQRRTGMEDVCAAVA
jgi:hypothetical protein